MNTVSSIVEFHKGRSPELLALKWAKIRSNPFVFFRGTARLFYEQWERESLPSYPIVWMCGDAHLENVGSYKGEDGIAYFDLNDFDEALLGPSHLELGRALTGLYLIGKPRLAVHFLKSYFGSLITGKPRHIEPEVARGPVAKLLTRVKDRARGEFLQARVKNGKLRLREGRSFSLDPATKTRVLRIFAGWAKLQGERDFFYVNDVCGRIAGNGSLGVERYMILVKGGKLPHIIDMKEASPPSGDGLVRTKQPRWKCQAERIATVQYFLQYVPPSHFSWIDAGTKSYIFRDLQPLEDRIDRSKLTAPEWEEFIQQWAALIASAHLRSAAWRGSAGLDELIHFGRGFSGEAGNHLHAAAKRCAREQLRSFNNFRKWGPTDKNMLSP